MGKIFNRTQKRDVKLHSPRIVTQRQLEIKNGAEGPKHDLYGYTEYIVHQNNVPVVFHTGLDEYIKVDGDRLNLVNDVHETFYELTGLTVKMFEKAYYKIREKCPICGCIRFNSFRGYPGEYLTVCSKCGNTIEVNFCKGEIE